MSTKTPAGLKPYRLKSNPEEARFADAWSEKNDYDLATPILAHLLHVGDTSCPPYPSERDFTVAATVIQWLGSPCGQWFLRDLGYVKAVAPAVEAPTSAAPVTTRLGQFKRWFLG